jgi:hypothetical protein
MKYKNLKKQEESNDERNNDKQEKNKKSKNYNYYAMQTISQAGSPYEEKLTRKFKKLPSLKKHQKPSDAQE